MARYKMTSKGWSQSFVFYYFNLRIHKDERRLVIFVQHLYT